ncbi:MAG: prepilin-type N-terminal cleavage/methylation domain-containing protein [Nitrospirota bacterium]
MDKKGFTPSDREHLTGFTLVELMIAMVISLIVLAGIYNVFISSNRSYFIQESLTDMQQNARASIEFMARELINAVVIEEIDTTAGNSSITFYTDGDDVDVGVSTGSNTNTTLNDTTKSWTPNEWQNKIVAIVDGAGKGQTKPISSNTSNQSTLSENWTTVPDSTSVYHVDVEKKGFSRTSNDNVLRYTKGGSVNQPFTDNITNLTLTADDPDINNIKKIDIQLTARTSRTDPNMNNQYHYYTVNTSVKLRNRD